MKYQKLRDFIESPLLQVVGSVGEDRRGRVGRGAGARVDTATGRLEIAISACQWPETIASLRCNPAIMVTFVNPLDYTSCQVRGHALLHPPGQDDFDLVDRYVAAASRLLGGIGLPHASSGGFFSKCDLWLVSANIDEIFVRAPGEFAGGA